MLVLSKCEPGDATRLLNAELLMHPAKMAKNLRRGSHSMADS